jgi:RecA/RadA recombinase
MLNATVDDVEKKHNLESMPLEDVPPASTGILSFDLLLGGGLRPSMYTLAGGEQSSKTTSAISIMAAAAKNGVPLVSLFDYEGSTGSARGYVNNILKSVGLKVKADELFGKKDANGKWVVAPTVRYRAESSLEAFYDYVHAVLSELPDKLCINGKWWLRFEDTKPNKAKYGEFADARMAKTRGAGLWIPAPDGKLQALFLTDSYPAMLPAEQDKDEANNSLALQARAFSKHIPRVKGRLAKKMVAILGINQIRAVPMAMFGPKEAEPGGQALRFYSDVRIKHTSRALSAAPFKATADKDFNEEENSVEFEGSKDTYRYVALSMVKNKLSNHLCRTSFFRIWVKDGAGEARGIDPVFDTIYYLKVTGQLDGQRKGFKLNLQGLGPGKKPIPWDYLKKWVLGDKETMKSVSAAMGYKPMSIRAFCFKQIQEGKAVDLYLNLQKNKTKDSADDTEESED